MSSRMLSANCRNCATVMHHLDGWSDAGASAAWINSSACSFADMVLFITSSKFATTSPATSTFFDARQSFNLLMCPPPAGALPEMPTHAVDIGLGVAQERPNALGERRSESRAEISARVETRPCASCGKYCEEARSGGA